MHFSPHGFIWKVFIAIYRRLYSNDQKCLSIQNVNIPVLFLILTKIPPLSYAFSRLLILSTHPFELKLEFLRVFIFKFLYEIYVIWFSIHYLLSISYETLYICIRENFKFARSVIPLKTLGINYILKFDTWN